MKLLLLNIALMFVCFNVRADDSGSCGKYCSYTFNGETGELFISGTGEMDDYALNQTGKPWNDYKTSITNIKIAKGITSIGSYAFSGTSNLQSIEIPDTVTTIKNYGIYKTGLTSVTIPDSVTTIRDAAFYLSPLTEVKFGENSKLSTLGGAAFNGTKLVEINIPKNVTAINWNTFYGVTTLQSVTIPDGVTSVGSSAFTAVTLSNIVCSEDNLARFLEHGGKMSADAEIICTQGECENALKGTQYASLTNHVTYFRRQADGSTNIYRGGKLRGFKNKRIYTVDEAELLSKPQGNKFRLRYK